ncbi:hypothetical protein SK128_025301 [Halocaridina rubra]|uniref:CHK kinase-like domain-containing protein n=1 Tax=Halocaridina rubra TaxID=373956 RepID=A0AAN8XCR9_HALRR
MASNSSIAPLYSPEEISKAWLERILSHKLKTQVSIQSWDMKIPEKRNGFLSEICFVEVLIYGSKDECKKIPLVVKFMSMEKERVEFIKLGNLGKREVSVYTHAASEDFKNFCFASGLDHPIPDVFCSCMGGDLLTIVLSDLNAKGYRMCAPAEGSTLQQIKSTFDSIAVIHAFGYASIYKNGREQFHIPFETSYLDDILDQGMRKLIKFFAGTTVEKTLHALVPFQKEMISVSQNYPLIETLVHGDLWAGNVMFTADDMKASIFDWQFACVDNPLCDVTSMLLISAEPAVYEEHLSEVLDCY